MNSEIHSIRSLRWKGKTSYILTRSAFRALTFSQTLLPCFFAYSILLSLMLFIYSLLYPSGSITVTITTGGVPEGIPSEPPITCESMKITAPTAHAQSAIACTRLLRNIGNRVDRVAYGGGFEDFLVGIARCMIVSLNEPAFRRSKFRRQKIRGIRDPFRLGRFPKARSRWQDRGRS